MYIEANVSPEDIAAAVAYDQHDAQTVIVGITENFPQDFTTGIIDTLLQASFDEGDFDEVYRLALKYKDKVEEWRAL